jgi:hypothetical protein
MSEEIWKPVPSKPEIMASSLGRILLPEREALMPNGGIRKYFTKPTYGNTVKASKTARHTYKGMYNKFFGNLKIHRLVCEAFHGAAPEGKPYVIHIDEDAHNNRPENLRWGSQEENLNMPKFIAYCKSRVGDESPIRKYLAKHGGL